MNRLVQYQLWANQAREAKELEDQARRDFSTCPACRKVWSAGGGNPWRVFAGPVTCPECGVVSVRRRAIFGPLRKVVPLSRDFPHPQPGGPAPLKEAPEVIHDER